MRECYACVCAKCGELLKAFDVPTGDLDANWPYSRTYLQYAGNATSAVLKEPYLVTKYHIDGLRTFLDDVVRVSRIKKITIVTHERSLKQSPALQALQEASGPRSSDLYANS